MTLSLPADPPRARRLTEVWGQVAASLSGDSPSAGGEAWWPRARSAIVFVVDGLGSRNLADRAGHARFLSARATKRDQARTVFPSTTASALTSLMTGTDPGGHGIVGYRARVPGTQTVTNQLTGWERDGLDPHTWQRSVPFFASAGVAARPRFVVSLAEYAGSGFTRAIHRGAQFVPADGLDAAVDAAVDLADANEGAVIYLYHPDLDKAGHRHGCESGEWTAALEELDAATARLHRQALTAGTGVVLTADHGMVDVPGHRHVLLADGDPRLQDVTLIGGEPRMLHLYVDDPDAVSAVLAAWSAHDGDRSWVWRRDDAVAAGVFGTVDPEVLPRIGEVVVAPRSGIAYYDDRVADKHPQKMVGQHGSLTPAERIVPLLPLGAFAA